MAKTAYDDVPLVQEGSGWWKGEGGYRITKPLPPIDTDKVAKALTDCDEIARLCGWK